MVGNPTNPTSVLHPARALLRLARPGRILVVDEAFMDAVPGERESLAARADVPGLVVVRSLTKTWGLPGLRIGYLLADPGTVATLAAAQPHWPVSSPALAAAEACSSPAAVAEAQVRSGELAAERARLVAGLAAVPGVEVGPGAAPFVLMRSSRPAVWEPLRAQGFATRRGDTFPGLGPHYLRVAVRPGADGVATALGRVLAPVRTRADACPGALTLHEAADGLLARIRLPGGVLPAAALRALAAAGPLELTSRANIQVRGLDAGGGAELARRVAAAGLLPSDTHELVRNIVASPLTGLDGAGEADVGGLVAELDRELCARPALADLPGRFLFAVDDGRGDLIGVDADVRLTALGPDRVRLWPGDLVLGRDRAVPAALAVAEAFLAARQATGAWRITELGGDPHRAPVAPGQPAAPPPSPGAAPPPPGSAPQRDGRHSVTAVVPLGRLTAGAAEALAAGCGRRGLRVTPWRSVVVTDVADPARVLAALAGAGLGVHAGTGWLGVSACTGSPGCAKALADVQADARAAVRTGRVPARPVHYSGCERRCGRPADTVVDVLATPTGYVEERR